MKHYPPPQKTEKESFRVKKESQFHINVEMKHYPLPPKSERYCLESKPEMYTRRNEERCAKKYK